MLAKSIFFQCGTQALHALEYTGGNKVLVAFHGYGQDASAFQEFIPLLKSEYTILSFDLPYHGLSSWVDGSVLDPQQFESVLNSILDRYEVTKLSVMGFSIGAMLCMKAITLLTNKIDRVLLMAPEGLKPNKLYYFLTRTVLGKKLFAHAMLHPQPYLDFSNWLARNKMLNRSQHHLAIHYLKDDEKCKQLLNGWPALSLLIPDQYKLRKYILASQLPITIYMGEFDRIITPKIAEMWCEGLPSAQLHIIPKGHVLYDDSNISYLVLPLLS